MPDERAEVVSEISLEEIEILQDTLDFAGVRFDLGDLVADYRQLRADNERLTSLVGELGKALRRSDLLTVTEVKRTAVVATPKILTAEEAADFWMNDGYLRSLSTVEIEELIFSHEELRRQLAESRLEFTEKNHFEDCED